VAAPAALGYCLLEGVDHRAQRCNPSRAHGLDDHLLLALPDVWG
jgi:hypothetical protein